MPETRTTPTPTPPVNKAHSRRQTLGGALITFSLPAGIWLGVRTGREHGFLIGTAIALLIPCLTILVTGFFLATTARRERRRPREH